MKRIGLGLAVMAAPAVGLLLSSPDARAGGFSLNEMGAASVGNAHAGGAAAAEDLSTIYFNPAGLSRMKGRQFMAAGSAIRPSAKFRNNGSTAASGPATGGDGGDAGKWSFVPALYYAMDLDFKPGLRFGIGVQSPFGLVTEYDANWVGRYQALKSELRSVDINPALSYQVNDLVSVGAGVSAQYVDTELSRAIDVGTACAASPSCAPLGLRPQGADGKVTVKGNDWGYGFNLGALFTPSPSSRFGIAYRSRIRHSISGDASFDRPAALPASVASAFGLNNTGANARVDLPESLSVSGYVNLDPRWAVMADMTYTRWSRFKELRISFANGSPDSVTPEEWRNTLRIAFAANYRYSDAWKLRGGVAWDPTPVRDQFRTARIPDNDRTWLSFGAQYKLSDRSSVDFGYAHLFIRNASINKSEPPLGGNLVGTYKNDVNILSVQYNQSF